jgi:hypothetical protein
MFRFVTLMLLFAQLMVMLFLAVIFFMFTVVPTIMVGLYGLSWVMKKMRVGRMGKFGKMHACTPHHVAIHHNWTKNSVLEPKKVMKERWKASYRIT